MLMFGYRRIVTEAGFEAAFVFCKPGFFCFSEKEIIVTLSKGAERYLDELLFLVFCQLCL